MQHDTDRIDPELKPMLEILPPYMAAISRDNLEEVRAGSLTPPTELPAGVSVSERTVAGPDADVPVLVYEPSTPAPRPALLWIHGGGYILGSADDARAAMIAGALGITVVSVEYRLAPEHPFPAGPEDCYAALDWLVGNASELGVDASRIALGGASAGGGMAAGVALMNRERANHPLALQLLLYPMIDNLHATDSGSLEGHPVWSRASSFNAWEMYLGGTPGEDASPFAAAARAINLGNLPPAYVCVGAEDLFRDEDIAYAARLSAARVPTELAVYPGLFHGADIFAPQAKVSQRLRRGFLNALADALGIESPAL